MTPRFLNFAPFIFEWETEFNRNGSVRTEHDPDDPGGTTRYGIDQRSHPHVDVEHLTKDQATQIYWDEWLDAGCDAMPTKTGECYFNAAVNCGAGRARQFLRESKGSPVEFLNSQVEFYKRLVTARPRSQKYLKGSLNRVNALKRYLNVVN